ncbi:hypothetical protein Vretimale_9316 [Volvox reticuliferus]|uniref:Uncharacterized protein n=1 Tax=Volvox reticuliferus TaxID=1737510 RepID=A0A8J4GDH9_9CHLO|nr:hypothetical protein Vretifemale_10126 [Volvox reticuliferus]GIM04816.1 hypothetical protein Vretimale_9316 [Volvox reticuliferus]
MSASELLLLKKSFERLDKQYRGAEEKIVEFRDKLREARLELAAKDKQLDATRKLLAKMGAEKSELAMVAEQSRELSRSLEAKLSLSHDVPELQAKLHRSKRKVAELTAQLHDAQTRLLMSAEIGHQQAAEVAVLKKALGLRMDLPDGMGVYDGQAQLLQALAKSQEESASLAAQLAEGNRRASSLEQQVAQLQSDMDRLVGARVAAEEALLAARKETGEAHGRAEALQLDLDELKSQVRRTLAHLQEVQSARTSAEDAVDSLSAKNRSLKDKLIAADRGARSQLESLRGELRSLAEAAEAEVQQLHALHAAREGDLEAQNAALQRQLTEMEARLSQSDRDHEVEVLRLQSRTGALEASLEGSRLREASLERDAESLRSEVARLSRHNAELTANLAASRNEAEAFSERAEEAVNNTDTERRLRMQVQNQMEAVATRAAVREEQLAVETQTLRIEAAALSLTNERLREDFKSCQEKLSDATARNNINERHIDELHTTIKSLTKSKTKLQNTMLEQLSLFKAKLHQVEQENFALRSALASVPGSLSTRSGFNDPRFIRPSSTHANSAPSRSSVAIELGSTVTNLPSTITTRAGDVCVSSGAGGVSGGGSSSTTTPSLTPVMSLKDSDIDIGGVGGVGAGASVLSRPGTSSLGLENSRSEEAAEATLSHFDA